MKDHEGNLIDLKPDSKGQDCACPTNARIARHFDAKVAERLAQFGDPGLVAVSERLRDGLLSLDPTGRTLFVVDPRAVGAVPRGRGNRLHALHIGADGRLTELSSSPARLPVGEDASPLGIAVVPRG